MFPFISSHFLLKGRITFYLQLGPGPVVCCFCMQLQNNPLEILFPRGISCLEGCETLAMQGRAVQPQYLIFLKCGSLVEQHLSSLACSGSGSKFKLSLQRWAASNIHKYPLLLCWFYHFAYKQTHSHSPSEPSGFDRCRWLFLDPLLNGKMEGIFWIEGNSFWWQSAISWAGRWAALLSFNCHHLCWL